MKYRSWFVTFPLFSVLPTAFLASAMAFTLIAILPQTMQPGFAQTHYSMAAFLRCTRDEAIMNAFNMMQDGHAESSLIMIVNKPVRVIFKDMKTIHKGLKNYDALSWISNQGEQVIFVNEKHRNAPPEALAAMLAHEAMHNDEYNSLSEEVAGWTREAQVWMEMKAKNPALKDIAAGAYPLVDRENRIEQEARHHTLESFVRNNAGYRGLAETSPGFGAATSTNSDVPAP
jgi:hypothetical protein